MFHSVGRILQWAKGYRKRMILGFICSFFATWCTAGPVMLAAWALGRLMENAWGISSLPTRLPWLCLGGVVILILLRFFFTYWKNRLQESIGTERAAEQRMELGDVLKRVSLGYFAKNNLGDILAALTTELSTLELQSMKMVDAVINGYIVGEHGDSQIPLWSRLSVGGITMGEYCASVGLPWTAEERARIAEEVRTMGASIISAKGKTHYGIATCVCLLADAVLNQRPTIASVSTPLQGEYGVSGVALSVPSIIGGHGVERRIQENWAPEELAAFRESACRVREALQ